MHDLAPMVPTALPVHKQIRGSFRLAAALVVSSLSLVSLSQQPVHAAVTGEWTGVDIGAPVVKGSATDTACSAATGCPAFAVSGAGLGIGGTSDQFMFLYQRLTGDGVVTLRLLSITGTAMTDAGVMVRESLTASSKQASILVAGNGTGLSFRSRTATGGATTSVTIQRGSWLRLERVGPAVTASVSTDGAQWTVAAAQTLSMASTVYFGIAVTSRTASTLGTATVSNMSVASTTPTLPQGWSSVDVGAVLSAGTASYSNGSFVAASSGAGLAGSRDAFRFVYTRVRGDATLLTQVVALEGRAGRQAGIVMRSTLDAGAATIALVADDTGLLLVRRAAASQTATKTRLASAVAPVYLKLDRKGSTVAVLYSTDGATWKSLANSSITFSTDYYAGLGVAAGAGGGVAAAALDDLSLVSVAANQPPTVSLTAPLSGLVVTEGKPVSLTANASDPDDLVAHVDFNVNGVKVATDSVSPYGATWTAGAPGVYSIVAAAADYDGAVTSSAPVSITVASGTGSLPTGDESSPPTGPWRLIFTASPDHAKLDRYDLKIYSTLTRILVLSRDLGKPAVAADGTITVDVDGILALLPAGLFDGVVQAVASYGVGTSLAYTFNK